jgi:hypothetical protein
MKIYTLENDYSKINKEIKFPVYNILWNFLPVNKAGLRNQDFGLRG